MTAHQLAGLFFLQLTVILLTCRLVGRLARRVGQPQVVGEMVAGVLLGPSSLGLVLPGGQAALFPPESLRVLYVGAQLGVGLYMFLVGVEFNTEVFLQRARSAASISAAGMAVPFLCGCGLAVLFLKVPGLFSPQAKLVEMMLFLGSALAITAFPMLARILYERGLAGSHLGTLALSAGAIGDVGAWCILAVVIASFGHGPMLAVIAVGGGLLYAVVMLVVVRRLLVPLGRRVETQGALAPATLGWILALFMAAVFVTDKIGIHAVFGGFLLGVVIPRGVLSRELQRQLEPLTTVLFLPMFFTFSGLNTRLDMVNSWGMLGVALLVLAVACLGKGVACWAAARWHGEDNRTALAIGSLMNARGLMELIIINIGLEHGIIEPPLFAVLVLMAIVTTLMASPLFEWVYGRHMRSNE